MRAIGKHGELLKLGMELAKFPLEPTYALSLLASYYLNCDRELTILVSILSSENVWLTFSRKHEDS